jgi:O-antigen/teichoic acid export membrane protein
MGTVLRGGGWQAAAQVMPLVINIVMTPFIISGLGIERYGLFLLVNVIALVLAAADGGIGGAALRYFAVYAGERDTERTTRLLVTTALLISGVAVVAFGTFFLIAPAGLALLQIPEDLLPEGAFLLQTLIVIAAGAHLRGLFAAILNAHGRFALTSTTLNVGYVIYITGVLLTIRHDWGLYGIAVTMMIQQGVATLMIVPGARRYLDWGAARLMSRAELKDFWRYALHTQWSNLMLLLTLQTDAIVVGAVLPVRQVAYHGTGANFALQLRNVPLNALIPMQSALGQAVGARGVTAALPDFVRLQRIWVLGVTGWGAVAIAAAWFAVTAWLGPEFGISGVVAVIMLGAYQMTLWANVLTVWAQAIGQPQLTARCASVAAAVNLVLTLLLVFPFGIIGTVAATAVSQAVSVLLLLRLTRRRLPQPPPSFLSEIPVLPSLATVAVVVALEFAFRPLVPQGPLGLLITGLVAGPGLLVFAVTALGPRTVWDAIRWGRRRLFPRINRELS